MMLTTLTRLGRKARLGHGATAAAVVAASSTLLAIAAVTTNDEEDVVGNHNNDSSSKDRRTPKNDGLLQIPSLLLHLQPRVTRCEDSSTTIIGSLSSLFSQPPSSNNRTRAVVRRRATIEKLQDVAHDLDQLESKYHVGWSQPPLGRGSFGAVYRGVCRETGQAVAVKQISRQITDHASFQREIDALLLLQEAGGHPNICGLRDTFEKRGGKGGDQHFYIIMDLIAGPEVFEHLVNDGAYSEVCTYIIIIMSCFRMFMLLHSDFI